MQRRRIPEAEAMHSCGRGDAFLITAAGGHIFHLPPGAILLYFRARRHFQNADGHTFAGKSRPVATILPLHRPRICQRYHILRKKIPDAAAIHRPQKKDGSVSGTILYHFYGQDAYCCIMPNHYIMPPIPPAGIAGAGSFSGISAMAHSVVRNIPATEAAFSRATRDTLVGSMTPASYMLTNSSVLAL